MLVYFGVVMLIASVFHFFKKVTPGFAKKVSRNRAVLYFRQKFANPALFGSKHSVPVKWGKGFINMSLPTRAQGWVLLGYFVMFIILMFIKYDIFDGNSRYAAKKSQLARYVADRAGIIGTAQLPLLFLFASRNNILLLATGWSYDTMNVYHRWVARVMYIGVFIHSIAFTYLYVQNGKLNSEWKRTYMIWGIVGTVCGGLLMFFSLRHFRERLYEFFLWCHWLFVAFFTAGTWYHLKPHGYMEWLYAAIAIWAFDRACRLGRIVFSGLTSTGDMEVHCQDFIKFKVNYSHIWGANPGCYSFVYFLLPIWSFWENHPFSCYNSPVPGEENKLVFCLRARGGKTKQLLKYLIKKDGRAKIPMFIEGPYGQNFPIGKNDTMVFIAGGIGFTATYSYAAHLKKLGDKKRIVFIWVARTSDNLQMFKEEIDYLSQEDHVDVQIYVTDETESSGGSINDEKRINDGSSSEDVVEKTSIDSSSSATIIYGIIPNLNEIVERSIAEASGSIGFMTCGPPGMNDAIRSSVTNNMANPEKAVNLYVEAFNW